MPTPPLFRFALMLDDTLWYYLQGGALYTSTIAQYLVHSPDEWENTELKWGRNLDYRTLLRSFSSPYKFVKEGAAILRAVFCKEGIEGRCKLVVEKRQSTDWQYVPYFSGDIDFSTFVDDTVYCTCKIVEGGLSALLKAYATTPQEIELRDTSSIKLYSDGIKLKGIANFLEGEGNLGGTGQGMLSLANAFTVNEGEYPIVVNNTTTGYNMGGYTNSDFSGAVDPQKAYDNYLQATQQTVINVVHINHPNFYYSNTATGSAQTIRLTIEVLVAPNPNDAGLPTAFNQRQIIFQDADMVEGGARTINIDVTSTPITLNKYDRLYIVYYLYKVSGDGAAVFTLNFPEGKIDISSTFRVDASKSQTIRLINLYEALCEKVAGSPGTAQSSLLNTPNLMLRDWRPFWTVATCGDALRGLYGPFQNKFMIPKIRTTFSDFIKTIQALAPVGFGVEGGKYVLEQLGYFFDPNTQVFDLGEVAELEVAVADEYYASNIRVGYEDQTYDGLNGKDEYNTSQSYKMPVVRSTGQVDFISPYRADMYGMEIYRANLSDKKTTDSKSDNDTFMVTIASTSRADGSYPVYRPQNLPGNSLTGVLFPDSAYNVDITPKHNLIRQGPWLKMMTYLQSGKKLTFQTTDKNPDVTSNLGSGNIVENSDVAVNDLPDLPFLPIYLRPKLSLDNLNELMSTYPKGYFRFTFKGQVFKGFLDSAGVKPGKLDLYQFQFLAHPELNILQLLNACAQ